MATRQRPGHGHAFLRVCLHLRWDQPCDPVAGQRAGEQERRRQLGSILTQAQKIATLAVFMLGNGYVSSGECVKEFVFGDMKKFRFVPVFLEFFADSENQFIENQIPRLCDGDRSTFAEWEKQKDVIDRLASKKQGAFSVLNMPDFVCGVCEKWIRKDTVCDHCRNWENAIQTSSKAKFLDAARVVGRYIDAAAQEASLPVLAAAPARVSQAHALRMASRGEPSVVGQGMANPVPDYSQAGGSYLSEPDFMVGAKPKVTVVPKMIAGVVISVVILILIAAVVFAGSSMGTEAITAPPPPSSSCLVSDTAGGSPCSETVEVHKSGTICLMPLDGYANSAACTWHISCGNGVAPAFVVTQLDTEADYDTVALYSGTADGQQLARLSGSLTDQSQVNFDGDSSRGLTVEFRSDDGTAASGFCRDVQLPGPLRPPLGRLWGARGMCAWCGRRFRGVCMHRRIHRRTM